MTICSLMLGATGIVLTFAPDVVLQGLRVEGNRASLLLVQIIGGLYFAFAMLNRMTKESLIGGIYNRPVAVANVTHFLIAGLAVIKARMSDPGLSPIVWFAGIAYAVLGILFAVILFRHPVRERAG